MSAQSLPDEWYYLDGSNPVGPFTRDVLRQLRNAGNISSNTSVACAGEDGWKPLSQHNLDPVEIAVPVPPPRNSVQTSASLPASNVRQINWIPAMVFQCVACVISILAVSGGDDDAIVVLGFMAAIGALVSWAFLHSACWKALPEQFVGNFGHWLVAAFTLLVKRADHIIGQAWGIQGAWHGWVGCC